MDATKTVYTYLLTTMEGRGVNWDSFIYYLKYNPAILGYWNWLPFVFAVKTTMTALELAQALRAHCIPEAFFMIAEINPANLNGYMPPDAWKWFYEQPTQRLAGTIYQEVVGNTGSLPPLPLPPSKKT